MPLVSVIIPTYNRGRLVVDAVDCVLRQTVRDVEVIVADDGSTDDTRARIEAIADKRVRYFYKANGGVSSARNLGLKHARGQYICFLDSDDLWPENFLEVMVGSLEKNTEYGVAYSARALCSPDGAKVESYKLQYCRSGWLTEDIFQRTFIPTSALCFRSTALKGFFFDESLRTSEDRDAWLKLSMKIQFLFVPSVEIICRVEHGVATISSLEGKYSRYYNRILVLERFYFKLGGDKLVSSITAKRAFGRAYRSIAMVHLKERARHAAIFLYIRAMKYWPIDITLYVGLIRSVLLSKKRDTKPDWQMPAPL